jgi:hypothetical protein
MPPELARLIAEQAADDAPQGEPDVIEAETIGDRAITNGTDAGIDLSSTGEGERERRSQQERIDETIDRGTYSPWLNDPSVWWYGTPVEDLMYLGTMPCQICLGLPKANRTTCPYCLRRGAELRLLPRTPPPSLSRRLDFTVEAKARKESLALRRASERERKNADYQKWSVPPKTRRKAI